MQHSAREALARELTGQSLPPELDRLDEAELETLAGAVADLKARQEREFRRAVDEALSHIPRLLRGSVRRILE